MKQNRLIIFVISLIILLLLGRYFLLKQDAKTPDTQESVTTGMPATGAVETTATPALSAATMDALSAHDKEQLQVLFEIFKSKNDNDPRMDQVLKNLSPALKDALQKQYSEMKMELRNERGTIAFLISRELKEGRGAPSDVQFLKSVLQEKPCLSLSDCSKSSNSQSIEEQHLMGVEETTAQYPQLITMQTIKQALAYGNLTPENKASLIGILEAGRDSPNPRIAQDAQKVLESIPRDENTNH